MREKLLVVAAALAAFGLTAFGSFHYDDYSLFSDPAITSPGGWLEVWKPLQTRPLTFFTFWLNYQAGGASPFGFHIVDLALHAAVAVMLLVVLGRLLPARVALIAALLFAVHPIQTEAVAYIFARGTLLSTVLCLLALWFWLKDREWAAVACFAAALLAKEECAAFPLFLIALSWRPSRRQSTACAAMLALSLAAGIRVIYTATLIRAAGVGSGAGISPARYFSFEGLAIVRYVAMLLLPWGFTVDPEIATLPALRLLAWLVVLAAIFVARRWFSELRAGFWFLAGLILLIPSSTLFPASDLAVDRRMYLPMLAFSACAALLLAGPPRLLTAALLLLLTVSSIRYSGIWMSERSLWSEAVERAPGKVRPHIQLARAVDPSHALALLATAQSIAPADPAIASEQGRVLLELGRPAEALAAFGRALALSPRDATAINNRGAGLLALGQTEAARQDFERALQLDPCLFDARLNLLRLGVTPAPAPCRFTPDREAQLPRR